MKYQVTLNSINNYNVTFPRVERKKTVNVDDSGSESRILSELEDVNTTGRLNNYLLIWNATTQTYDHVPPSEVLDRSDGIDDGAVDYGTF
jgi:hypothetical protein